MCVRYEINDTPCGHAVASILRLCKQPQAYVPKVFALETHRWTNLVDILYRQILWELSILLCVGAHVVDPRGGGSEKVTKKRGGFAEWCANGQCVGRCSGQCSLALFLA